MGELVTLHKNVPLISTFLLFEIMGYREHRTLKKVIKDNFDKFEYYGLMQLELQKPKKGSKGGRPDESYLLNEDQFILLIMLAKNNPSSVDLKFRVSKEFSRMKKTLASLKSSKSSDDYLKARNDGKEVYHQKTDVIKQFVDYATKQGSKSASRYYASLATMENSALFFLEQKYPNVREVLNIRQLMLVATADQVIEKALLEGMEKELHYKKDIYPLAKKRVIELSEIVGKSAVIQLLEDTKKIEEK